MKLIDKISAIHPDFVNANNQAPYSYSVQSASNGMWDFITNTTTATCSVNTSSYHIQSHLYSTVGGLYSFKNKNNLQRTGYYACQFGGFDGIFYNRTWNYGFVYTQTTYTSTAIQANNFNLSFNCNNNVYLITVGANGVIRKNNVTIYNDSNTNNFFNETYTRAISIFYSAAVYDDKLMIRFAGDDNIGDIFFHIEDVTPGSTITEVKIGTGLWYGGNHSFFELEDTDSINFNEFVTNRWVFPPILIEFPYQYPGVDSVISSSVVDAWGEPNSTVFDKITTYESGSQVTITNNYLGYVANKSFIEMITTYNNPPFSAKVHGIRFVGIDEFNPEQEGAELVMLFGDINNAYQRSSSFSARPNNKKTYFSYYMDVSDMPININDKTFVYIKSE